MIDRLPEDAQTAYAETLALLLAIEGERGWSHLAGSFARKTVKGVDYLYFQYSDPGGTKRQFSIGRHDAGLAKVVEAYEAGRAQHEGDLGQVRRLAGVLRAGGTAVVPHGPMRVIRALGDAGLFASGGVLMGSYAFQALGNLLGVTWPGAAWHTQDVDIAGALLVAVPPVEVDVPRTLESLEMGFVPVPKLDPEHPSTSFRVRGKPLRLDLITPGRESDRAPIPIPRFRAAAAPIKYLSLAMEETQPALAVDGASACLVTVPSPARFALHKLLVSRMRSLPQQTKGGKDVHQAALLLEVLAADRPRDLEEAAAAFVKSGGAVTQKVLRGLDAVEERWPSARGAAGLVRSCLPG